MMQSILNIREDEMRQWEKDARRRKIEAGMEMMREMFAMPSRKIIFHEALPEGQAISIGDTIYIPESQAYKWIFFNNEVSDKTVKIAMDHARQKVYKFIDNFKA